MAMTPTDEARAAEVENIKNDMQKLRDDLGTLLSHIGSFSKGRLGSTRERVSATAGTVQERTYDRVRGAADRGWQAVRSSRDTVQRRPLTSLMVAFAAGMIIASVVEWKRS
jgi:ElaB/YqjD/DUF883 family membrane-anchored ribosome-binding protein